MSNQRANVKNPNNPEYVIDHKNSIRQLQRIQSRTVHQEERLRELQRENSQATTLQRQ